MIRYGLGVRGGWIRGLGVWVSAISSIKNKHKFIKEISFKSTFGALNLKDLIFFFILFPIKNKKRCIKGISLKSTSDTLKSQKDEIFFCFSNKK